MKVFNIMLSRRLGGIEQVFLDYTEMLRAEGVEVIPILHPQSVLRPRVSDAYTLPNFGKWDIFAMLRLWLYVHRLKPDRIITHGNRALSLARYICKKQSLYPVAHNYWIKHFRGLHNAIAITKDVAEKLKQYGIKNVAVVPNSVRSNTRLRSLPNQSPPIIGAMGRMVYKKGLDIFLRSLAVLHAKNIAFKAIIGGAGKEECTLKNLCKELQLEDVVTFLGWVEDKEAFFQQLDVFCVPSRSEPFGIVLLEAFANGVPVVSTNNQGAMQIATHQRDAILCHADALAPHLEKVLINLELRKFLHQNAFLTVKKYSPTAVGKQLKAVLFQ